MAYVDTDLTRGFDVPKTSPEQIVQRALDGLEAGAEEVLADALTQRLKQAMTAERPGYLQAAGLSARQAPAFGAVVPPAHPAGVLTWREAFMAAARS